jgi:hypothetical protein
MLKVFTLKYTKEHPTADNQSRLCIQNSLFYAGKAQVSREKTRVSLVREQSTSILILKHKT